MAEKPTVEALIARRSIEAVIGRLARAQDRLERAAIIDCYHFDAEDDHLIFAGGREGFADWLDDLLGGRYYATMHLVGPPLVEVAGTTAQSNTQCVCHHLEAVGDGPLEPGDREERADLIVGMRYLDRFESRDGNWRIARRQCLYDWCYHGTFEESGPSRSGSGRTR